MMAAMWLTESCSTTSNLPEGEYLYTGIKSTTIHGKRGTVAEDVALTEVDGALAYTPNNAFMGSSSVRVPLPIGLWIYNKYVNSHEKFPANWLFNTFGTIPKTISMANPATRAKIATNILQNYGYFNGNVGYEIVQQRDSLKQKVAYDVTLGEPYMLDTIKYMFPETEDSIVRATMSDTYLKTGNQFSVPDLQNEKLRLVDAFRNNGFYYYRPDYINLLADSVSSPMRVKMLVAADKDIPEKALRQWRIGKISTYIRDNSVQGGQGARGNVYRDSLVYGSLTVAHQSEKIPIKARVMFRNFKFWTGRMYDQRRIDATLASLNNMHVFSSLQFAFTPADDSDTCRVLNVRLDARMDKLIDAELDFNVTQKSNSQVGPNLGLRFSKRNAFRHGETLSLRLKGSYEWQTHRSMGKSSKIDSYEYGLEAGITYPWIVFPGFTNARSPRLSSSAFKLSFDELNRATYYKLMSFGVSAEYKVQATEYLSHTFTPITVTYNKLLETSAKFDSITDHNSALYISLRDQFIPAMQYTLNYDNTPDSRRRLSTYFEASVKEAGNLLSGINAALGYSWTRENKKLLGSPYSQFVKLNLELRNNFRLTTRSSIATRVQLGTIWTYGNSSVAPYSELYYVGGANSVRAFAVRSIGPGRYYDYEGRGTYLDQSGDVKFEMNAEYRFNIVSQLNGALFVDAGNVWLLHADDSHPGGKLEAKHFLKDLALGTGFGLRYDMEFLVLRLDVGIGIHSPYDTGKKSYYNIRKFYKDGVGIHFAVGYPF